MKQIDIETFLTLNKTGSLTKAAETLYVSQPTVSHRLKDLEEELGISLLMRGKGQRRIELTQKGEEFVAIAERWLALMAETSALRNQEDEIYLRIGCPDTLNNTVMLPFYRRILNDPTINLKLNLSTHYSHNIYDLLEQHAIDLGFVFHILKFKNIIVEPVLRERMVLVQESSGAVSGDRIYLNELDPANEICFYWESNYQIWHDQMISKGKRNSIEVDIFQLLSFFLEEPCKWTIAPLSVARYLKQKQNVVISDIADKRKPPERITYMIKHKDLSEAREADVNLIRDQFLEYFSESINE
ncbi:MAG: LysR family transcriptional regulator [Mogibacterium sp.]|jgi:DNA-binding transcriptional LysR family regulator|nr:LysR family transcriptional regulator [Mogibacterium sp.]